MGYTMSVPRPTPTKRACLLTSPARQSLSHLHALRVTVRRGPGCYPARCQYVSCGITRRRQGLLVLQVEAVINVSLADLDYGIPCQTKISGNLGLGHVGDVALLQDGDDGSFGQGPACFFNDISRRQTSHVFDLVLRIAMRAGVFRPGQARLAAVLNLFYHRGRVTRGSLSVRVIQNL